MEKAPAPKWGTGACMEEAVCCDGYGIAYRGMMPTRMAKIMHRKEKPQTHRKEFLM